MDLQTTSIGKYDIEECIGRGAMGYVYRARDEVLKRTVALKTIATGIGMGPQDEVLERFRREARSAAGLNHPNIVTVFDYGEAEGQIYLVMELLDGLDLSDIIKRKVLHTPADKLSLMRQIASGVGHAHAAGIVHRDLKPANVRVLPDGTAKIMDFGLARMHQAELTPTGRLVGTPHYMAPELVRGQPADGRADVFSLGVMFYELLTGRRPFPAPDIHAVLFQILQRQPDSVRAIDATLPEAFDTVLLRALAKSAVDRHASASELYEALLRIELEGAIVPTGPTSTSTMPVSGVAAALGSVMSAMPTPDSTAPTSPMSMTALTVIPTPGSGGGAGSGSGSASGVLAEPVAVVFQREDGEDKRLELSNRHMSLLDLALEGGIPHFHECGGRARCSTCRLRVLSGQENFQPRTAQETKLAQRLGWPTNIRLACQSRVKGPVKVERLVRDNEDIGILLGEQAQAMPAQEMALAVVSVELLEFDPSLGNAPPYDLIHMLNRFFFQIGDPMVSYGGRIQGYTGGGFRVFFGLDGGSASKKCLTAVRAALRATSRMASFNRYTRNYFSREFRLGVGLHFGRMIVGNFGHPSKVELSTIGSRVLAVAADVAARNESSGTSILATEEMINVVEDDLLVGHVLTDEPVGGQARTLYEIVDLASPEPAFVVQRMFELVEARREEAAALFYELLFELAPDARELFSRDLSVQGEMLMSTLSTAIHGLDSIEELVPVLKELGERHVEYGVKIHQYELVEHALMEMVQRILGVEMTAEQRLAWAGIYNKLVTVMTEGQEAA